MEVMERRVDGRPAAEAIEVAMARGGGGGGGGGDWTARSHAGVRVRSRLQFSKIDFVLVDAKAAVMIFDVDYGVVVICGLYGTRGNFFSRKLRNICLNSQLSARARAKRWRGVC